MSKRWIGRSIGLTSFSCLRTPCSGRLQKYLSWVSIVGSDQKIVFAATLRSAGPAAPRWTVAWSLALGADSLMLLAVRLGFLLLLLLAPALARALITVPRVLLLD